jgi:hypothetical protein
VSGTRLVIAISVLLLLAADSNCKGGKRMPGTKTRLNLAPLAVKDAASVAALELLETPQGAQLLTAVTRPAATGFGAETVISTHAPGRGDQGAPPLFAWRQVLPPPPAWDVAVNAGGSYALVYEKALGATYTLVAQGGGQTEVSVAGEYHRESFTRPRFVKRHPDEATRAIVAIAEKKWAVLFVRRPDGRYDRQGKLCDCSEALVVPFQGQFLLFYKVTVPGPVRGNLISPGRLYWLRLGRDFTPVGGAQEALPGHTVYEFDADVAAGALAVLATTATGTRLAVGAAPGAAWAVTEFNEAQSGANLTRPAVLVAGPQLYAAFLENALSAQGRVLVASAALGALR